MTASSSRAAPYFLFRDAEGLIAAVDRLAAEPELRRRIGAAARDFATAQFGMRGIAARYLDVYGLAGHVLGPPCSELPETGLGCGSSVLDQRFHTPVAMPAAMQPLLITTVDAEESFDWSAAFSAAHGRRGRWRGRPWRTASSNATA